VGEFEVATGGLVFAHVRDVVKDEQVVAIELGQCLGQLQGLSGRLKALHELAGAHVQHAVAGVDQRVADAASQMALAHPGGAEDQTGGALVDPGVAAGQRHHVGLGQHRDLGELEAGQRLGCAELRLVAVTLDAPGGTLGDFVFEQGAQEAARRPAFLVRALGELRP